MSGPTSQMENLGNSLSSILRNIRQVLSAVLSKSGGDMSGDLGITGLLETVVNLGRVTGTVTVDLTQGGIFFAECGGNCAWVFEGLPPTGKGRIVELRLKNAGSFSQLWPTGMIFSGGVKTFTPGGIDKILIEISTPPQVASYPINPVTTFDAMITRNYS